MFNSLPKFSTRCLRNTWIGVDSLSKTSLSVATLHIRGAFHHRELRFIAWAGVQHKEAPIPTAVMATADNSLRNDNWQTQLCREAGGTNSLRKTESPIKTGKLYLASVTPLFLACAFQGPFD